MADEMITETAPEAKRPATNSPKRRGRPRKAATTPQAPPQGPDTQISTTSAFDVDSDSNSPNDTNDITQGRATLQKGIAIDDLISLRSQGLSYAKIAQRLNCSTINAFDRLKPYQDDIDFIPTYRRNEQALMDIIKSKILRFTTDQEIKKASFRDKMIAFGILTDKSNKSVTNNNVFNVIVEAASRPRRVEIQAVAQGGESGAGLKVGVEE